MATDARAFLQEMNVTDSDHVVFLGDLVDRGAESGACVDLAIERERRQGKTSCILGNHEESHIAYDSAAREGMHAIKKDPYLVRWSSSTDHMNARSQLDERKFSFLRSLPYYLRIPEHNVIAVHAGVWPNRPIHLQKRKHLLHLQSMSPDDRDERSTWPSKVQPGNPALFWTNFWTGPERIVFGHSVLTEPLVTDKVVGLDGGGCFGLELWALVLPDNVIVRHKCLIEGRKDRRPPSHHIMNGVSTY